jgi:hypothetical protein
VQLEELLVGKLGTEVVVLLADQRNSQGLNLGSEPPVARLATLLGDEARKPVTFEGAA